MSQGPRHINTDRSLNRPTEQRPTEASALHQVSLSGQPDFFQNEQPAPRKKGKGKPGKKRRTVFLPAPAAGTAPPEHGRRTRRQRRQSAAPARGPR